VCHRRRLIFCEALTKAPAAAQFKWRAACEWKNGTHSHSTVEGFYGLGQEQHHKKTFTFDADHPEIFASEDQGAAPIEYVLVGLASCLTGAIAAVAQYRNIQLRSVTATIEGDMDVGAIFAATPVRGTLKHAKLLMALVSKWLRARDSAPLSFAGGN
jgi:organic hydroperoxide reductase OsmC/OhrA